MINYVHSDVSMAKQKDLGPLHSKGKIRVFLLQEVFALVVHAVGVSEYKNYTAQAQERLEEQISHFSFEKGRGLVTSMLLW